jgi:Clp amino terminal domain, pathogenicity island component
VGSATRIRRRWLSGAKLRCMFERFTDRSREVIVLAQDEARTLWHNYIGTEHILLGLRRRISTLRG